MRTKFNFMLEMLIKKCLTWKQSNIPTAITTPIDKPIAKIAEKRISNEGGGNGIGLGEKMAKNHETKTIVATREPPTALARNAVKYPWLKCPTQLFIHGQ